MKKEKLLHKLRFFFDPAKKRKKRRREELKKILKNLKKKEQKITDKIEQADDECLKKLYQTELEIIRLQRKKGIGVLQQLRENKDSVD
jgi:site-specific DNA-adenine methylase